VFLEKSKIKFEFTVENRSIMINNFCIAVELFYCI
jgi:hypothetical protein